MKPSKDFLNIRTRFDKERKKKWLAARRREYLRSRKGGYLVNTFAAQRSICYYCKRQVVFSEWSIDHIIPIVKGGKTTEENCIGTCRTCNNLKGSLPHDYFKAKMESQLSLYESQDLLSRDDSPPDRGHLDDADA